MGSTSTEQRAPFGHAKSTMFYVIKNEGFTELQEFFYLMCFMFPNKPHNKERDERGGEYPPPSDAC